MASLNTGFSFTAVTQFKNYMASAIKSTAHRPNYSIIYKNCAWVFQLKMSACWHMGLRPKGPEKWQRQSPGLGGVWRVAHFVIQRQDNALLVLSSDGETLTSGYVVTRWMEHSEELKNPVDNLCSWGGVGFWRVCPSLWQVTGMVKKLPQWQVAEVDMFWDAESSGCCRAVAAEISPQCCMDFRSNTLGLTGRSGSLQKAEIGVIEIQTNHIFSSFLGNPKQMC